jgi:hypothetical protein
MKADLEHENPNDAVLRWTVHPIRRDWKVSTGVILFLIALCAAVYFSFGSPVFLILSAVVLISSLSSFFFPTTYIIREDDIMVKSLLRRYSKNWDSFKSYYPDKNGVLLSPFPYPSRLENFRGLYIRFDNNGSEILDYLKNRVKQ